MFQTQGFIFSKTVLYKAMVKVTPVQALRLCTGRTGHRGSRGIALPFHDHGTRRRLGVSATPRPLFTPGKTRYPLYSRLGGPRAGLDRCGKSRPHRDSIPGPSSPQPVAIPTAIPGPHIKVWYSLFTCIGMRQLYIQVWHNLFTCSGTKRLNVVKIKIVV